MNWRTLWRAFTPDAIDLYADFIDPFCYIGFHNLRRAAEAAEKAVRWRGFELNPDTPPAGAPLETAANSDLRAGMWESVREFALRSGLSLRSPDHVPNTRSAHALVGAVKKPDVKNRLIERIYQAYFSDKKDIGEPGVLLALAGEIGLDRAWAETAASRPDARPLERHRREAVRRAFPGMPGFVYRGKTYFGALSEDHWKQILSAAAKPGDWRTANPEKEPTCSTR